MSYHYTYDEPEDRKIMDPGDYDFVIAEVFAFEQSKSGNDYLPIRINIQGGGSIFDNLVFTEKAKFRIDQLLKSIGRAPAPGSPVDFDNPSWLVGSRGRVRIGVEEFNSKKKNKVEAYLFSKGEVTGRRITAPAPATAPTRAPEPEPADEDDDGIPF